MNYEWDLAKSKANARKHGVDFADAAIALSDELAITMPDPDSEDEERFVSLGVDPNGRVLITVFSRRGQTIRIVSSRKASRGERRQYEEGL